MKLFVALFCFLSMALSAMADNVPHILPRPVSVKTTRSSLTLHNGLTIAAPSSCKSLAAYAANMIKLHTGWNKVKTTTGSKGDVVLVLNPSFEHAEGYALSVEPAGVTITAATANGLRFGLQTLRQMLPTTKAATITLPGVAIYDYPRFAWRGVHLDVSRHFFTVDQVKRFLDRMAMYKYNRFHWHLTDDQGWRLEIKSHPELTRIGAWRKSVGFKHNQEIGLNTDNGRPYGGFYTQKQVKEVLAHAASLGITVIPEIDLPGHSQAAIAAYPQVFCFPEEKMDVWTEGGVSKGVMCAGREETFTLLNDVLKEVIDLFPSQYIHLGGDEAPKDGWRRCPKCQQRIKNEHLKDEHELQSYFMNRLERFVNAHGRKMIGWDEIMDGGLSPTATVMSWRSSVPGKEAAMAGNDVIMTPSSFVYLNRPQSVNPVTQASSGILSLKTVYSFNPMPEGLSPQAAKHILGVQACQWSENTPDDRTLYYKEFPRAIAVAEIGWTAQEARRWDDFSTRLNRHLPMLSFYGIGYGQPSYEVTINMKEQASGPAVELLAEVPAPIYYTTDGTTPTRSSAVYKEPVPVTASSTVKACTFLPNGSRSQVASQDIYFHRALGKKVIYNLPYGENHDGGGPLGLTNGMLNRWQGFEKQNADFVVDMGSPQAIDSICTRWMFDIRDWVLRPTQVTFEVSADGTNYTQVLKQNFTNPADNYDKGVIPVAIGRHMDNVRFIRIRAVNPKVNPEWHSSAGGASWIFIDEVVVK